MSGSLLLFNSRETNSTNELYGKRIKLSDPIHSSKKSLVTHQRLLMQSKENVEKQYVLDVTNDDDGDEGCCVIAEVPKKNKSESTLRFLSGYNNDGNSRWRENIKILSSINSDKNADIKHLNNTNNRNLSLCSQTQRKKFFAASRNCLNQNKMIKSRLAFRNNVRKRMNFLQECYRLTEKHQYIQLLQSQTSCLMPRKNQLQNLSPLKSIPIIDLTDENQDHKVKRNSLTNFSSADSCSSGDEDIQIIKEVQGKRAFDKFPKPRSLSPNIIELTEQFEPKTKERSFSQIKLNNAPTCSTNLSNEGNIHVIEKNFKKVESDSLEVKLDTLMRIEDRIAEQEVNNYKKCFLPKLTSEQEKMVKAALVPEPWEEVLTEAFGLHITRKDMQTLKGSNWLNDEIINFYLNLIMERSIKNTALPKVYAFNTFFYPKLVSSGYLSLKRWTKQVDVFSYDIVLVPVHLGMHWCLSVIDFRTKFIKYFDSVGSPNDTCLQYLLRYLEFESLDKKNKVFDVEGWILAGVEDTPQQMNGSDCGVFSCMFAEYQSRDAEISFTQDEMPYFRKKIVFELLTKKLLT